jgi:hypothetical protein
MPTPIEQPQTEHATLTNEAIREALLLIMKALEFQIEQLDVVGQAMDSMFKIQTRMHLKLNRALDGLADGRVRVNHRGKRPDQSADATAGPDVSQNGECRRK